MGDVEELSFGAYLASTPCSGTLDDIGTRFEFFVFELFTLAYYSLALDVANIKAFRSNGVCVVHLTHPAVSAGVFMYSKPHFVQNRILLIRYVSAVCYDLTVLVLSILRLSKEPSKSALKERLRAQGLLYFAVATIANVLPTVWTLHVPLPCVYSSSL